MRRALLALMLFWAVGCADRVADRAVEVRVGSLAVDSSSNSPVVILEELGGELPRDVEGLCALKGVGRYTAGAVASIAFDRPAPVVDGNVARVLTRLLGIREDARSAPVVTRLWEEAEALARGRSPGDLNQALMELGATVCTPRAPLCET